MTAPDGSGRSGPIPTDDTWRGLYTVGAVAALVAVAGTLLDIVLTLVPGWEASTVPATVELWFAQFHANPWLGLRNLDLLNVTISVLSLPLFVALYGTHRQVSQGWAALALACTVVGTAVFVANNAALPMLELSRQFAAGEAQRPTLYTAAAALLARGAHGSLGAFPGFLLSSLGTLLMTLAMVKGRVFSRLTSYVGMVGISLLIVYIAGATFVPAARDLLMILALPGGLLMIAWNVLVARRLFQLGARTAPR
jgi:hypothetical protein